MCRRGFGAFGLESGRGDPLSDGGGGSLSSQATGQGLRDGAVSQHDLSLEPRSQQDRGAWDLLLFCAS